MGNELADSFAKEAARTGVPSSVEVPVGELKRFWRESIRNESQEWCLGEAPRRGSLYCSQYFSRSRDAWFEPFSVRRRTVASINRLRSGHTSLRASLHRFFIVNSPFCDFCGEVETPNHVFWVCPRYAEQRHALHSAVGRLRGLFPHPIEYLLATLDEHIIRVLDTFICGIPLYI